MADTAKVVERVADRFVKQITNAFEAALAAGASRISEAALAAAFQSGSRQGARQQAERGVDADSLRVLAKRQPLEDHLLDVAEASANATRCMTRPTGSGVPTPPAGSVPLPPATSAISAERATAAAEDLVQSLQAVRPMPPRQRLIDSTTDYVGGSEPINAALRYGQEIPLGYRQAADDIAAAISHAPMAEAKTLYRIVPNEVAAEWRAGTTMTDPAFVSTTKSPNFLREMAGDIEDFGGSVADFTLVEIRTLPGTGGLDVNELLGPRHMFARQKEIILGPGTRFQITEENGRKILSVVKP